MKIGEKAFVGKLDSRVAAGYRAFACHQAAIFVRLADEATEYWVAARALASPPDKGKV